MSETLMTLGRAWALTLYEASWQIALLVAAVSVVSFLLRRSSPAVRYGLWCIVLVRLCFPAAVDFSAFGGRDAPTQAERAAWRERRASGEFRTRESPAVWRERIARTRTGLTVTSAVWGAAFASLALFIGFKAVRLHRRIRTLPEADDPEFLSLLRECSGEIGLRRRIQVRYAPDAECAAPAVTAVFKPVVILPETMVKSWSRLDLKPILMHELAHVRRCDVIVNWIQIVLQCVYFFHPLVWLANWKIRSLREEACDDLSISSLGGRRSGYSNSLLRAVELANGARPMCGAVALHERRSDLIKRVRRLLSKGYKPCREGRTAVALKVAALGSACLLFSGIVPAGVPFACEKVLKHAVGYAQECRGRDGRGDGPARRHEGRGRGECGAKPAVDRAR